MRNEKFKELIDKYGEDDLWVGIDGEEYLFFEVDGKGYIVYEDGYIDECDVDDGVFCDLVGVNNRMETVTEVK